MRLTQTQVAKGKCRSSRDRDSELRDAHKRAFDKMESARWSTAAREEITKAIDELIDACEAYTN